MNRLFSGILSAFFPKTCACCGEIVEEDEELCDYCREMIRRCDPLRRCIRCGMQKKECVCKSRLLFFDGCIAPFVNTDVAQNAIFRLKYHQKPFIADFFAREMAWCVKNEYRTQRFDVICYVPMVRARERRRGYNQSHLLAERIGKLLHIPVFHNLLICRRSSKPQHELNAREREKNVAGLYTCKTVLDGMTVLLVDDIKTTGATLNECAKQLTIAGAASVWCVTALCTDKKKEGKIHGNRNWN